MPKRLHELFRRGGVDGPVDETVAAKTMGIIYLALEADSNLTDEKRVMLAELYAAAYSRALRSRQTLMVTAAIPYFDTNRNDVKPIVKS